MSSRSRDEKDYVMDGGLRLLKVLEALEGTNFEAVNVRRVEQRTGFSYDFCRRALITLKLAGFAAEQNGKWMVGPKLMRFGTNFNDVCIAYARRPDSEISESGGGKLGIS